MKISKNRVILTILIGLAELTHTFRGCISREDKFVKKKPEGDHEYDLTKQFEVDDEEIEKVSMCTLWQYRLWSFQGRDTKLERFLTKNQL